MYLQHTLSYIKEQSGNGFVCVTKTLKAGSLKRNTALEYGTRVVHEGDRRCKKSTLES